MTPSCAYARPVELRGACFRLLSRHWVAARTNAAAGVLATAMPVNTYRSDAPRVAGLLYAASLWFSNASYLYLSVSFIQMMKSLMPGLVYASGVVMGTEKYSST